MLQVFLQFVDVDAALGRQDAFDRFVNLAFIHALIGAGVYASHGYERSHVDGVKNTLELLAAYLDK